MPPWRDFRAALSQFLALSEVKASKAGLSPRQHQALLAIRGAPAGQATIGYLADRLILKPHSASELITRLKALDLIVGRTAETDRRKRCSSLPTTPTNCSSNSRRSIAKKFAG